MRNSQLQDIVDYQSSLIKQLKNEISMLKTSMSNRIFHIASMKLHNGHYLPEIEKMLTSESLPINIFVMDTNGIIDCNNYQISALIEDERKHKIKKNEIIGKNWFELGELFRWEAGIPNKIQENIAQVVQAGKTKSTKENPLINGVRKFYTGCKKPLLSSNVVIGFSIDITEIKNKEASIKMTKEKVQVMSLLLDKSYVPKLVRVLSTFVRKHEVAIGVQVDIGPNPTILAKTPIFSEYF